MALWVEKAGLPSDGLTVSPYYSANRWGLFRYPPGAFVGSTFYLTGGESSYDSPALQYETYSYVPSTDTWTMIRDGSNNPVLVPHPRTNTTGASVDGRFCTLAMDKTAGSSTARPVYLDYYTPSTKTWTTIAPTSGVVRYNVEYNACVGYGTRLYSFGGIADSSGGSFQRRGQWYDFSTNTWGQTSEWTAVTTSRAYQQGACVYGSKIYLFGGAVGSIFPSNFMTVLVYDPATDTWTSGGTMPNAMWFPITGVIDSSIWVTGKYGGTGKTLEYDPATQTFTDHTEADHLTNGWDGAGGGDGTNLYHACPGGTWQNEYSHTDYASHVFGETGEHAMLQLLPKHWGKKATMSGSGTISGGSVTAVGLAYVYPGSVTVLG